MAHGSAPVELVVLVGLPASGKSSFYRDRFAATHEQVSKDRLRQLRSPGRRQEALIDAALRAGRSVVVDNINATAAERAPLIRLGRAQGVRIVGYFFDARPREAVERNRRRLGRERVPDVAIHVAAKRLEPPSYAEGFDELYDVRLAGEAGFDVTVRGAARP